MRAFDISTNIASLNTRWIPVWPPKTQKRIATAHICIPAKTPEADWLSWS